MLDLSVIILTYNEEVHISRCIENIKSIAKEIYVVDSFSTDKTVEIAESFGANVFQNKWPDSFGKQTNWALDNLPIHTKWVLRLDADEYLTPELIKEMIEKLPYISEGVTGIILKRRHIFIDKWIKRGTYPIKLLRLFQFKKARCEERWTADEHMKLLEGFAIVFANDFVDHNLNNLAWWINKHNRYSIKEAVELLDIEFNIRGNANNNELVGQAAKKRNLKIRFAKSPLFLRSFIYFIYRYIFRLGFTEGKEGFLWHFLQGWWYRTLVDAIIFEIKKKCGHDKEKIIEYIKSKYNIDCTNR
jgi:glycosyltransferase involved in cell wall biosynthesis